MQRRREGNLSGVRGHQRTGRRRRQRGNAGKVVGAGRAGELAVFGLDGVAGRGHAGRDGLEHACGDGRRVEAGHGGLAELLLVVEIARTLEELSLLGGELLLADAAELELLLLALAGQLAGEDFLRVFGGEVAHLGLVDEVEDAREISVEAEFLRG